MEVAESYRDWLRGWLPSWKAGRMLTIDYGAEASTAFYHRRPHGSVRAYFMQQRIEGPGIYESPGRQDLTADVNFTDLQRWAEPFAVTRALRFQAEFLMHHANPSQPADVHAVDIDGAGEAFLVLEQEVK